MDTYNTQDIERAHQWLVKASDTLHEAQILAKSGKTRSGAYNRLYYASHHIAVALLRLIGVNTKSHTAILSNFSLKWIKTKKIPVIYKNLLVSLKDERTKADYGEFVPSHEIDINKRINLVVKFLKKAQSIVPKISIYDIIQLITTSSVDVKDFSFDIYCPKSYYHHTWYTLWIPKGRIKKNTIQKIEKSTKEALKSISIKEKDEYVVGLNSRVNQYQSKQLILLDFDNISSFPIHKFNSENGVVFRTDEGFHFIGFILYNKTEWERKMKSFKKIASTDHIELSLKRGYATLRISTSIRKPFLPIYTGRINAKKTKGRKKTKKVRRITGR